MERKFGTPVRIIKQISPFGSTKILKYFFLNFLYEVVKAANRILPDQLDKDNQLIGLLGRVL